MGVTCGTCRHWEKQEADPANLGAPPMGACKEGPPQFLMVMDPRGMGMGYAYPNLPANFNACSRYLAPAREREGAGVDLGHEADRPPLDGGLPS